MKITIRRTPGNQEATEQLFSLQISKNSTPDASRWTFSGRSTVQYDLGIGDATPERATRFLSRKLIAKCPTMQPQRSSLDAWSRRRASEGGAGPRLRDATPEKTRISGQNDDARASSDANE